MNPALQNYLQNQQQQQVTSQQPQQSYNPFDAGIQKAIASARQSLRSTAEQEEASFNKGLLAFGDRIAQTPPEKGFWNNLTSAGRALSPAIRAYDDAETANLAENQALANQILKYQAEEQERQAAAEERAWRRNLAEQQLGEQRRYHNLMYGSMGKNTDQTKLIEHSVSKTEQSPEAAATFNILNNAEKLLKDDLEKQNTYRGRFSNLLSKFTPGGYIPNKEQAQINALGDVLRGKLFNTWGYRNQAEFEHVPSISADNPPEVNLEIIQTLKNLFANPELENESSQQFDLPREDFSSFNNMQTIKMRNQNGEEFDIPYDQVKNALIDPEEPLTIIERK